MLSERYINFFARQGNERHVFLQGGRRSRKTWSTYEYLAAVAGIMGRQSVTVLTYQFPQLQATMRDFEQCLGAPITGNQLQGLTATTAGGVRWRFVHCDNATKAQGTECDFLFINEAVNVPQPIIDVYALSVRHQIIYNFNPTAHFEQLTIHGNGNNLLCTTWRDNPHLTPQQVGEFEALKTRAQSPNATLLDEYNYRVYYLGEFSTMAGRVFPRVEAVTEQEYTHVAAAEYFGLDFGFSIDGDPTAAVAIKVYGGWLYVRQLIYERGLTSDRALAERLVAQGVNIYTPVYCDIGGLGRTRMLTIRQGGDGSWTGEIARGLDMRPARKGSIMDGLSAMLTCEGVRVVDTGAETRAEFESYRLENGRPKGADHAVDAARYAYMTGYLLER